MAAGTPVAGQGVERFRARLRDKVGGGGGEPGAPAVVRVYAEALRVLTLNCKPVITELTTITGQHTAVAPTPPKSVASPRLSGTRPPSSP
jgi:pre-mRNA cleavage complex 2 protein Pcf11